MKRLKLLMMVMLVLLAACSSNKKMPPMEVVNFRLTETVEFDEQISKAYYYPSAKTVFAMNPDAHQILIRKGDKQPNIIGGLGTGNTSFMALADITMGPDGSIYALDGAAKQIKRFNSDGKYLSRMELNYVQQPQKLALGNEQNVFIYDAATTEIISFNLLDGSELYRFGRFQLERVDQLYANRDFVLAYDRSKDQSALFSSLGQFISTDTGQIVYDQYNNAIGLSNEALVSKMSAAWLPVTGDAKIMTISRDTLAIIVGKQLRLLQLDYAPVY